MKKKILSVLTMFMLLFGGAGQAMAFFEDGNLIRIVYDRGAMGEGEIEVLTDLGPMSEALRDPTTDNYFFDTDNFDLADFGPAADWDGLYVAYVIRAGVPWGFSDNSVWTSGPETGQRNGAVGARTWTNFNSRMSLVQGEYYEAGNGDAKEIRQKTTPNSYWNQMDFGTTANDGSFAGFLGAAPQYGEISLAELGPGGQGYVDQWMYYYPGLTSVSVSKEGVRVALIRTYADGTTEINPGGSEETGSLTVTISPPEVVTAGAQWRVDGGAWQNNGATQTGLSVGQHTLGFKVIEGWTQPANKTVTINDGETTVESGTYTPAGPTGSLTLTIEPPEAVTAGAQWRRVGTTTWQNNGATEAYIPIGQHTVEFKDISGWTKPDNKTVTINEGETTAETGTYTKVITKVKLLSPNGGEVWVSGSSHTIEWEAPAKAETFKLQYSIDKGETWKLIADNLSGTSHEWTIEPPTNNKKGCLVQVTGYDVKAKKVGADKSDKPLTIEVVRLISPNGGEELTSGIPYSITWWINETARDVATVSIMYSMDGGETWKNAGTADGTDTVYDWTPSVKKTKSKCKVKITLKDDKGKSLGSDISDAVFKIIK